MCVSVRHGVSGRVTCTSRERGPVIPADDCGCKVTLKINQIHKERLHESDLPKYGDAQEPNLISLVGKRSAM